MNLRGPKVKISRRLGIAITPKAQKWLDRRPYPPGQHGPTTRNPEPKSVFGKQLREKQRLRAQYNVSESQMRRYFSKAHASTKPTGEALLHQLESRLDALIYRAGFARSIFAARQYAAHGHFLVNGRRVTVPSIQLRPGDTFQVREKSRQCGMFADPRLTLEAPSPYVAVDREQLLGTFSYWPTPEEIPVLANLSMITEFYSR